ncbi:MAG: 23S rRNA (uracil(1939)-C(5))-methyltransferase RlmD, partial [Elusimicrobiota bacterium]
ILISSADRVKSVCPAYPQCGGCQLLHYNYAAQLTYKKERVVHALQRIGGFTNPHVKECEASEAVLNYRNKIQLPVAGRNKKTLIGFYERGSHKVIDLGSCPIHCKIGDSVFSKIKPIILNSRIEPYSEKLGRGFLRHILIKTGIASNQTMIILVTNGLAVKGISELARMMLESDTRIKGIIQNINTRRDNVILGEHYKTLEGSNHIMENLSGLRFKISAPSFFQINPRVAGKIYGQAVSAAQLTGGENIIDVYCGSGALSLLIAKGAARVVGIDNVPHSIRDAHENARINKIKNVRFECNYAENAISNIKKADCVFLNPPRAGCGKEVLCQIQRLNPGRVVYVSCDPATLARDLKILCEKKYNLEWVKPFDMFPQTAHVESLAFLKNYRRTSE